MSHGELGDGGKVSIFASWAGESFLVHARPEDLPVPLDPEMDGASESVESKGRGRAPSTKTSISRKRGGRWNGGSG